MTIPLIKRPASDGVEELSETLKSQTLSIIHMLDCMASLYSQNGLSTQAEKSVARLQQLSGRTLSPTTDPALRAFEDKARAARFSKTTSPKYSSLNRLQRMEQMGDTQVTALIVGASGELIFQAARVVNQAARAVCKMTPVREACDKRKKGGPFPPLARLTQFLERIVQQGQQKLVQENLKLGIDPEMSKRWFNDMTTVAIAGITLGSGNKVKDALKGVHWAQKAENRLIIKQAGKDYHQLLKKEQKLVAFLDGALPPITPSKYSPQNLNQFSLKALEHPFIREGFKGTLKYNPLETHILYLITMNSLVKPSGSTALQRAVVLLHETIDFSKLSGKSTLVAYNPTKIPLMTALRQSDRPIQVLRLGSLGQGVLEPRLIIAEVIEKAIK